MPLARACVQLDWLEEEAEVLAAAAANVAKVVGAAHLGPAGDRWGGPGWAPALPTAQPPALPAMSAGSSHCCLRYRHRHPPLHRHT